MAHALERAPARAVSVSVSAVIWAGALACLAFGGRQLASVLPEGAEPAPIPIIEMPPPDAPAPTPPPRARGPRIDTAVPLAAPTPFPVDVATPPLGAGLGAASDPAPPLPVIVDPHWLRRPTDLARFYPERALQRGKTGQVMLDCLVDTAGNLSCRVASETPEGWGFGQAALRIAGAYQMVPATVDGAAVAARYQMRVPFRLD